MSNIGNRRYGAFAGQQFRASFALLVAVLTACGAADQTTSLEREEAVQASAAQQQLALTQGALESESDQAALLQATQQTQEGQTHSNLQQQLQTQIQDEGRSYTAITNIMKTKHDTTKNSISNVR